MKNIYITIFLMGMGSSGLFAQNIDINREKDKKEKSDESLKIEEKPSPSGVTKPTDANSLDFISISDAEAANVVIMAEKKERGRSRQGRNSKKTEMPPARKFRVRLYIQNRNPHPMWYLMPYNGADRLPENAVFNAEPSLLEGNRMVSLRVYDGEVPGTSLREILFTGLPDQHFRAFYLPAGGSLSLRNYRIDCWQDSEAVEFWAVKELKVNNSTALDKILTYELLSSSNTEINCPEDKNCISRVIEPESNISNGEEPIRFIKADKLSKYLVRLNQPQ